MSINNITGPPVEGDNFFGREKEVQLAWDYISAGNNLVFAAPRRVGKTSMSKRLLKVAATTGWNTLELNLEEVKTEKAFVKLIIEKLEATNWWKKLLSSGGKKVNKILERVKIKVGYEEATASLEWKENKTDVYEDLKKLLNHSKNTLIMIDELTVLLNSLIKNDQVDGIKNVESLLNWLRSLRHVNGTKIRWIFCSSVGIANFCNIHGLSYTLNDVSDFNIGAYKRKVATEFLQNLAISHKLNFTEDIINYIIDEKITWHLPYFLQLIFKNIYSNYVLDETPINFTGIDRAFNELCRQNQLDTWDERLSHYGYLEKTARRILNHNCQLPKSTPREKLIDIIIDLQNNDIDETNLVLSRVIRMLINDGYLMATDDNEYTFRSSVIKGYWHKKFIK